MPLTFRTVFSLSPPKTADVPRIARIRDNVRSRFMFVFRRVIIDRNFPKTKKKIAQSQVPKGIQGQFHLVSGGLIWTQDVSPRDRACLDQGSVS
jgi:hypothetical protein